jgi:hypothetical protein
VHTVHNAEALAALRFCVWLISDMWTLRAALDVAGGDIGTCMVFFNERLYLSQLAVVTAVLATGIGVRRLWARCHVMART